MAWHNRNRTLLSEYGRFAQRDPVSSGLGIAEAIRIASGLGASAPGLGVMPDGMFIDGNNLYQAVLSNPVMHTDALGLYTDPFDAIDEIIMEHLVSASAVISSSIRVAQDGLMDSILYTQAAFLFDDMIMDRDAGILFGMAGGALFARACFVEGTDIATLSGPQDIECIELGQAVHSRPDPELLAVEQIDFLNHDLRIITLFYSGDDGRSTQIELLRPAADAEALGAILGRLVPIHVPELDIAGSALVTSIEPFGGTLVPGVPSITGRFITQNAEVVDVHLFGEHDPIGATPGHPFFSADRGTWIAAALLQPGERVQTLTGTSTVDRVTWREGLHTVYNLEVHGPHTYFVGKSGAWVHNATSCHLTDELISNFA
ncbi:MAG: hypothetical protein KIT54_07240 [Phycisphaeraceae bacterium]|nr:hypothetical protein [Phycisphaeraceae bacterium]